MSIKTTRDGLAALLPTHNSQELEADRGGTKFTQDEKDDVKDVSLRKKNRSGKKKYAVGKDAMKTTKDPVMYKAGQDLATEGKKEAVTAKEKAHKLRINRLKRYTNGDKSALDN